MSVGGEEQALRELGDRVPANAEPDTAAALPGALAEREAGLRATLDAALDCVIRIDRHGLVTYFNAAAARTFGYRAEEVVGRELAEVIIPPSLRDAHRAGLARHLATGEERVLGRRIELTAMRSDGTEFPVELTVTRIDLSGAPVFTGYVRDITERRKADHELDTARNRLEAIANEQGALRRVATLVAKGATQREVFDAVCEETGRLLGATNVNLAHFTEDGYNLTAAGWSLRANHVPTGTRLPLDGETINLIVRRTRAPTRVETYEGVEGELAALLRRLGIRSEVAAPVDVQGAIWGALIAGSDQAEPFPEGTEARLASFAELIATAVGNATARAELIAAQRRVIEATDAARRRLTRDIHDGAQQQFVNTLLNLQLTQQKWLSAPDRAKELLDLAAREAAAGIEELRELAAGIHPAILSDRGLAAALDALAARMPIPVSLDVAELDLPPSIEASIYFFCSEALTNVVKHAAATSSSVSIRIQDDVLTIQVQDDGVGGARFDSGGSGLLGLHDRVAALEGTLDLSSRPRSDGTTLTATIPIRA
jgi:PAS domain S-box-containing protein